MEVADVVASHVTQATTRWAHQQSEVGSPVRDFSHGRWQKLIDAGRHCAEEVATAVSRKRRRTNQQSDVGEQFVRRVWSIWVSSQQGGRHWKGQIWHPARSKLGRNSPIRSAAHPIQENHFGREQVLSKSSVFEERRSARAVGHVCGTPSSSVGSAQGIAQFLPGGGVFGGSTSPSRSGGWVCGWDGSRPSRNQQEEFVALWLETSLGDWLAAPSHNNWALQSREPLPLSSTR